MGQQQRARPLVAERLEQRLQARARARVDQHVVDLPAPDHALATEVHEIDHAHGGERPSWALVVAVSAAVGGLGGRRDHRAATPSVRLVGSVGVRGSAARSLDLGSAARAASGSRPRRRLGRVLGARLLEPRPRSHSGRSARLVELRRRALEPRPTSRARRRPRASNGVVTSSRRDRPSTRRRWRGSSGVGSLGEALGGGLGQREQLAGRARGRRRRSGGARPRSGRCRRRGP